MHVRFGYVAMSLNVQNASPSKTMTLTAFSNLTNREAAIRKLERIAGENLHNTLRLLRHNRAHDIHVYRFSSKLIPLFGHESLGEWNPIPLLKDAFQQIGSYVKDHQMRVSFHPDHFTVMSTPRREVLLKSKEDLWRHHLMLEAMGLDKRSKCNIHMGGIYGDKEQSLNRFITQFRLLDPSIQERITLENDDKTFNAEETLAACQNLQVPMVLDIHHDAINPSSKKGFELWPRIIKTWESQKVPPKVHVSSPKSEKDVRAHADFVQSEEVIQFLKSIRSSTSHLDVMIEAKKKDNALFQLIEDFKKDKEIQIKDQASIDL